MIIPSPLVLTDVLTEDVGERLNHPFDLAVTRGVITSCPRFMNTELLAYFRNDRRLELSTLITVQDFHDPLM